MAVGAHHEHVGVEHLRLVAKRLGDVNHDRHVDHRDVYAVTREMGRELGARHRCMEFLGTGNADDLHGLRRALPSQATIILLPMKASWPGGTAMTGRPLARRAFSMTSRSKS